MLNLPTYLPTLVKVITLMTFATVVIVVIVETTVTVVTVVIVLSQKKKFHIKTKQKMSSPVSGIKRALISN